MAAGVPECPEAEGVDFYAPADLLENSRLDRRGKLTRDIMIARVLYQRESFAGRLADCGPRVLPKKRLNPDGCPLLPARQG